MNAKRGFVPEDEKNFSVEALQLMRTASRHICYLINEGYDLKQASTFVGNHYLLSERQRLAIMRSVGKEEQVAERRRKQSGIEELAGKEVWIDGFNTIITLEVILSDSIFFTCMDGTLRDLAALRGTYRLIPETDRAVRLMLDVLAEANIRKATILLDEPVSNSGRLKAKIAEIAEGAGVVDVAESMSVAENMGDAEGYPFDLDIRIQKDVDRELYDKELVVTSDSIILDHCISWVNLTAECLGHLKGGGNSAPLQVWE